MIHSYGIFHNKPSILGDLGPIYGHLHIAIHILCGFGHIESGWFSKPKRHLVSRRLTPKSWSWSSGEVWISCPKSTRNSRSGPWDHGAIYGPCGAMWGHAAVTFWQVKLVKPETYFGDGTMFKELQDGEFRVINSWRTATSPQTRQISAWGRKVQPEKGEETNRNGGSIHRDPDRWIPEHIAAILPWKPVVWPTRWMRGWGFIRRPGGNQD